MPGTRKETQQIASELRADPADVRLGLNATETAVKQAQLDQYRIVYFATHGLVAGDLELFAKTKADFDLTTREGLLHGGNSKKPGAVPFKAKESRLFLLVTHQEKPHMPSQADGTWVMCVNPATKELAPAYVEPKVVTMHYEGGLVAFVNYLDRSKQQLHSPPIAISREREVVVVEVEDRPGVLADLTRKIAKAGVDRAGFFGRSNSDTA